MARGAAWMFLFKWVERGLGFISTLILVRLLAPEDFGMVAMAFSFIVMAELLTAFAFDIALIHDQKAGIDHYNSAWTAEVLLGALIATIMWFGAEPVAIFYNQPDLTLLVRVLALGPLFIGFENIGIVAFRKELDFRKEFTFQISRKMIGFCVTIPLAVITHSYWALVFGTLAGKLGGTLLSYWVHPFRPRPSFKEIDSLLRFSRWMLLNNVVNFLKERSTDFFIGRLQGPGSLGLYNVSYEFANLPTFEIGAPLNRALLPGFAKLKDDAKGIRASFRTAVGLLALIAIPIGAGIFAISPIMVPVVLGEAWLAAIPIMEVLSLSSAVIVFHGTIVTLFIAVGRPREATKTNFIFVIFLAIGLTLLIGQYGATGAAISMLVASILTTPIYLLQLRRFIGERFARFVAAIIRPTVASIAMVYAVRYYLPDYELGQPVAEAIKTLVFAISIGAATYTIALLLLWLVFGKRQGPEGLVLEKVMLRYNFLVEKMRSQEG